jgi:hypothetical protein
VAKIGRNARSGQFVTVTTASRNPRTTVTETVTIRDVQSGRELPLKGYGSMKGKFVVKPGVDLSRPIAEQAGRSHSPKKK